jgi:predicted metal-dependent HD superfamily phosphohydrolase
MNYFDDTKLKAAAISLLEGAKIKGITYHNIDHINSCYRWAKEFGYGTNGLELAILFHDIVYDEKPHKEFRSAQSLVLNYQHFKAFEKLDVSTNDIEKAFVMIMATSNHKLEDWPAYAAPMIRIDLADLTSSTKALENWFKVKEESINLYGIDEKTFAENNLDFMRMLKLTVMKNRAIDSPKYRNFWEKVEFGINQTIDQSKKLISELS